MDNDNRIAVAFEDDTWSLLADLTFAAKTELVCAIGLTEGKTISIKKICDNGQWYFILEDDEHNRLLVVRKFDSIFDGVERFVGGLEEKDAEILWNWFVSRNENGE